MSSLDETKLQRGLIITDDISPAPILDFDKYRNAITKIIKESYPKFSIGIYGDWGSGKTTLMQSIYDQFIRLIILHNNEITGIHISLFINGTNT